ncbi:MAG TPA: MFS transporter [Myxococcaceae bacterium]|nr:MFS transporter [Myxococcaceae bacterium]
MTWRALNPWSGLAGLPRDSWLLALATLVNRAGTMVIPFLALHFTRNLGFSAAQAGLALGVYGIVSLLISPFAGRLADRIGAQRILTLSLVLGGPGFWALPLLRTLPQVLVGMVVLSAVAEAMRPATLALVGDLAPSELRRQAFALNRLAINLGMSVGPALGGFLAAHSFRVLFWVNGASSIAAGLVLLLFPLRAHSTETHAGAPPALGAIADRRLRYVILCLLPVLLVFFQHDGALPVWMVEQLGLSTRSFGLLFTLNTLLIVFLEVRLNAATAHWSPARALSVGSALCTVGFGALAFLTSYWGILATVVVWTVGEMILFPSTAAYVSELAPAARRGEYMGFYSMTFGIGFTVGPWAGLSVLGAAGARTLWLSCLAVGALSTLLLARIRPEVQATVAGRVVAPG